MSESGGSWLPPGQAATGKFPVVGETAPGPGWNRDSFQLEVNGCIAHPRRYRFPELLALPQRQRIADIHCVTGWSRRAMTMRGVPLADLLVAAQPLPQARFIRFVAHSERAHDTSLPLELALVDTWLVHEMDGLPLDTEHGGPLRSVTPGRYFYKSLKWLTRIELLAEDAAGYWERESGYHNDADPWREQRFDELRIADADEVRSLRDAADFSSFRGRVLLRARLGGWEPRSRDLSGLQLKYCSLRKARLRGAHFRDANLSLSNLEGADLRDSRFEASDLEGASFAGADLRGTAMRDVALSATRFFRDFGSGRRLAARVEGLSIVVGRGLLDDQRAFLTSAGAVLEQLA